MGANGSKDATSRSSNLQSIHFKNKPQEQVDFGTVFPNGLYSTTPQDFDSRVLRQLVITRKLSPFYQGNTE
jgi:Zn-dependent M16 (insulinase) family peptidase